MERKAYHITANNSQLFKLTGHQICIICDANEKKIKLGTGFLFMRNDWIVTAAHVVQVDGLNREKLFAQFPNHVNNIVELKVLAIHSENDIALLQITSTNNPCTQPLYPGYDELSVSRGLICCGYTPSKGSQISISLAKIYNKDYRERQEVETILEFESQSIEGGSSGGPIFGDGGVVLGILINIFTIPQEPNKTFARATSIHNLTKAIKIDIDKDILKLS